MNNCIVKGQYTGKDKSPGEEGFRSGKGGRGGEMEGIPGSYLIQDPKLNCLKQ